MKVYQPKDYSKFVKTWAQAKRLGEDTGWVSKRLKLDRDEVRGAAQYLRNRGVELPSLRHKIEIPAEHYNQIIASELTDQSQVQSSRTTKRII